MDGKPDRVSERERTNQSPLPLTSWCRAYRLNGYLRFFSSLRHERELRCDRVMALQPNQKIKHPHPPANGKTVAHISAKHCVYRWSETEHIARREENFDELLRVPRINEPKINVHRAVHGSLVSRRTSVLPCADDRALRSERPRIFRR